MDLIKVGRHVINVDFVESMCLLGEDVALVVNHVDPDAPGGLGRVLRLRGEEATAFRAHFVVRGFYGPRRDGDAIVDVGRPVEHKLNEKGEVTRHPVLWPL